MTKYLISEIEAIKTRLEQLSTEDSFAAEEIRADFFSLIKATESFSEYLEEINNLKFSPENFLYNNGNIEKKKHFNLARQGLLDLCTQITREVKFGALKPKLLPAPETVSFSWLWKNASLSFWSTAAVILIFAFGAGAIAERNTKSTAKIIEIAQDPMSYIKSKLGSNAN